jgi:hypothetical protein
MPEWVSAFIDWIRTHTPEIGFFRMIFQGVIAISILGSVLLVARQIVREFLRRYRNRHARQDFYYKERLMCYRLLEDGQTCWQLRIDEVVPLRENLTSVPLGYGWTGEGDVTEDVKVLAPSDRTGNVRVGTPAYGGRFNRYLYCDINPKIPKRWLFWKQESCKVQFDVRAKPIQKKPEPFLASRSEHRVDKLVLRVAFRLDRIPAQVVFRVLNNMNENQEPQKVLEPDPFTGEFAVVVNGARPHVRYYIGWVDADNANNAGTAAPAHGHRLR